MEVNLKYNDEIIFEMGFKDIHCFVLVTSIKLLIRHYLAVHVIDSTLGYQIKICNVNQILHKVWYYLWESHSNQTQMYYDLDGVQGVPDHLGRNSKDYGYDYIGNSCGHYGVAKGSSLFNNRCLSFYRIWMGLGEFLLFAVTWMGIAVWVV